MQVERRFEQVKNRRVSIELPDCFNDRHVEIIVLALDEPRNETPRVQRCPHPDIAGQVRIYGDILSTVPESDWNLP
ncbi:hypothetical protein [Candidatus Thiodictyon syntrophicum]|jgi:hypothetical protein|uniref:Uncharacterized protein n=1 Tax=Candidatus Thiodictyon syntrophicum TaxID=1166950 RepID=A0A2K8U5Y4_9GAMM|nr:hypothetical protein [Candidatus Thiodictyon syntrophicum]AUB80984.1 hypothetical protein THSYN_08505 [Candidatus Thiodictyon syntrophicum]